MSPSSFLSEALKTDSNPRDPVGGSIHSLRQVIADDETGFLCSEAGTQMAKTFFRRPNIWLMTKEPSSLQMPPWIQ